MTQSRGEAARQTIVDVVLDLVETEGYDAVRLRDVAKRGQVSLATIYKLFPTREDLIFAALDHWREENVDPGLDDPVPGETLAEALIRVLRHIFEPWEQNPRLLEAFHRVRLHPQGEVLTDRGTVVVRPVVRSLFGDADPAVVDDVLATLGHVVYGVVGRFADGDIPVTDILPAIERAVVLLTASLDPSRPAQ